MHSLQIRAVIGAAPGDWGRLGLQETGGARAPGDWGG